MNTHTCIVRGAPHPRSEEILTPDALTFLSRLDGAFAGRRADLLAARRARSRDIAGGGELPDFLPGTEHIRSTEWQIAPPAAGLERRHVEITGPATPRMTINALNSDADVWMADLEDAMSPRWESVITSQATLRDAIRGELAFTVGDKDYRVTGTTPTIMLRPRGWHLCEKHLLVDGRPLSASLVDFGLYFFHNAQALIDSGRGPYFYLPKLESHLEARLWNDVFVLAQDLLGIPQGTVRATVLIETLPAAFEMTEILYELRDHSAGLNAGRWDYIFSYIRTFAVRGEQYVLPDRAEVTMTTPFLRAYTELLVQTCHRHGAHAIGGMAAAVPDRQNEQVTARALATVARDKSREAGDGFDGSWVAHPALVQTCRTAFREVLGGRDDQRDRQRPDVRVDAGDLLTAPAGRVSLNGIVTNVSVALRYLSAWVGGAGAVAVDNLMEDAATVEISRAQLWQWIHHRTRLSEGPRVTSDMVREMIEEESARLVREGEWGTPEQVAAAADILRHTALQEDLPAFFTPYAYVRYLTDRAVRMAGPISAVDLRMSEEIEGHGDRRGRDTTAADHREPVAAGHREPVGAGR